MNHNDDYLMHHGIKGQKWGVRRYQNEDGTYTEEGKARRRVDSGKAGVDPELIAYTAIIAYEAATLANAVRKSKKAKAFVDSGKNKKRIERDKTVPAGTRDNVIPNGYKKLTSKHDSYSDVIKNKQVNPETGIGSNLNCLSCSMAVELRRRGIDATATKGIQYLNGGRPIYEIGSIFKDPCPRSPGRKKVMSRSDLETWAKKNYPKGARGTIAVFFQFGGGHAMSWDIDKSGKFTIYDGQSGKIVDKNWASEKFLTGWQNSYMTRLDNLEINTDSGPNNKLIRASED